MEIFRTYLKLNNTSDMIALAKENGGIGNPTYEHNDLWSDFTEAYSYITNVAKGNERVIRAEMWLLKTQDDFSMFQENDCLFEYDIDGHYYHEVNNELVNRLENMEVY